MNQDIDLILNQFQPITLDEMDAVKLMDRADTKFAFHIGHLPQLLDELKDSYRILEVNGLRASSYRSLYYESDGFQFFNDHHKGLPNRFKVRYRKYMESDLCFLEVKNKRKGKTFKSRVRVPDFEQEIKGGQLDFLQERWNSDKSLEPKLWNEFSRVTLVAKERSERLTLDLNLKYEWGEKSKEYPDLIIAELKQEKADRKSPFYRLMKKRYIRPLSISKYCMGMIRIHEPDLPNRYNLFREKLRKVNKICDEQHTI